MLPLSNAAALDALARLAFQATRDAFVAVGGDGRIIVANPAASELLGSTPEKLAGQPLLDPSRQEPGSDLNFLHPSLGKAVFLIEPVIGDLPDAVKLYRLTSATPAEEPEAEGLGVLAGGIAHKFNNLLTSILGFASLASREVNISPLVRTALQQIEESSHQAAGICSKMLAYAGKGRFVVERTDLNALVRDRSPQLEAAIPGGVGLELRLADDLPVVLADVGLVWETLFALVANSVEAIADPQGKVDARTPEHVPHGRITISTRRAQVGRDDLPGLPPGECVVLKVADTGCGMDESTKARIFEPFFTTKYIGRGLSMSAVLGIVRRHQGAIRVDSSPGQGTTIQLFFPAVSG